MSADYDRQEASARVRAETAQPDPVDGDHISVLELVGVLLKHRYTLLAFMVVMPVVTILHLLFTFSPTFTADGSFIPEGYAQSGGTGLKNMADRFGVQLPSAGGGAPPEFYIDLLGSREILRPILTDTFTITEQDEGSSRQVRGSLLKLLGLEPPSSPIMQKAGLDWLKGAVSPSVTDGTGIVVFSVTTPWPHLSEAVARRLLDRLNEFNIAARRSQAGAERVFIDERRRAAGAALFASENALKRFLEMNRQFQNSPELVFEHDRLQRQVTMQQELFTNLSQAYEEARISEVRTTPVITVLEQPQLPVERNPRGLAKRGIVGIILGLVLGSLLIFFREFMSRRPADGSGGYQTLRTAWEETLMDFRRLSPHRPGRRGGGADPRVT